MSVQLKLQPVLGLPTAPPRQGPVGPARARGQKLSAPAAPPPATACPVVPLASVCARTPVQGHRTGHVMHTCAVVSTHPTSLIDLLFFTAWARHFPPSLVILFFPSLQRESCMCQPPAVRGLSHPHRQHRALGPLLGGVAFLLGPTAAMPCRTQGKTET